MQTTHARASEAGWLRAALRRLITQRGYTALTHNLIGLPLGILYVSWL